MSLTTVRATSPDPQHARWLGGLRFCTSTRLALRTLAGARSGGRRHSLRTTNYTLALVQFDRSESQRALHVRAVSTCLDPRYFLRYSTHDRYHGLTCGWIKLLPVHSAYHTECSSTSALTTRKVQYNKLSCITVLFFMILSDVLDRQ